MPFMIATEHFDWEFDLLRGLQKRPRGSPCTHLRSAQIERVFAAIFKGLTHALAACSTGGGGGFLTEIPAALSALRPPLQSIVQQPAPLDLCGYQDKRQHDRNELHFSQKVKLKLRLAS